MTRTLGIVAIACLAGGIAYGQYRGSPKPMPDAPLAEFHMARLAYNSAGGYAGSGRARMPMWAIDYPDAEINFLPALARVTRVQATDDSVHVPATDDRLFDYPWLFMQQAGQGRWDPTAAEAERLREYLMRGGFLVVDDFHGPNEWAWFEQSIRRVLPGRAIVDIQPDDSLLGIVYDVDQRTQIPGKRHLSWSGQAYMDGPPHWRGIYDDHGRLIVAINHNIDMGDAWEHANDPEYPTEMTGLAYRFGVNYVIYAMTH